MYEVYFADLESQKDLIGCNNPQEAVIVLNKTLLPSVVQKLLKDLQTYLREQIKKPLLVEQDNDL